MALQTDKNAFLAKWLKITAHSSQFALIPPKNRIIYEFLQQFVGNLHKNGFRFFFDTMKKLRYNYK